VVEEAEAGGAGRAGELLESLTLTERLDTVPVSEARLLRVRSTVTVELPLANVVARVEAVGAERSAERQVRTAWLPSITRASFTFTPSKKKRGLTTSPWSWWRASLSRT